MGDYRLGCYGSPFCSVTGRSACGMCPDARKCSSDAAERAKRLTITYAMTVPTLRVRPARHRTNKEMCA